MHETRLTVADVGNLVDDIRGRIMQPTFPSAAGLVVWLPDCHRRRLARIAVNAAQILVECVPIFINDFSALVFENIIWKVKNPI
ncbi:hypothetical protein WS71_09785 [Burkholderia mayonis]|uniref:Uncharacterized protein n=1 Tax=Burkholderia mayonis TaxID=1385591 RepID=A0A1B4FV54_9BURK|nr:hypothetical protein WS71_09785 [Burkholderia mayonis]KVE50868.1 hypothetical protein WS71_13380 [Burkholderia mayonis]